MAQMQARIKLGETLIFFRKQRRKITKYRSSEHFSQFENDKRKISRRTMGGELFKIERC